MYQAGRKFAVSPRSARTTMVAATALGAFFVMGQGYEWVRLIGEGLTITTSTHAGFFYLIVGTHALHAICGLAAIVWCYARLLRDNLSADAFWAGRLFWYFVVLLWPVLYAVVYL